jgi:hypothetical protein
MSNRTETGANIEPPVELVAERIADDHYELRQPDASAVDDPHVLVRLADQPRPRLDASATIVTAHGPRTYDDYELAGRESVATDPRTEMRLEMEVGLLLGEKRRVAAASSIARMMFEIANNQA